MNDTPRVLCELEDGITQPFEWGRIQWLCNDQIAPDTELTFGIVYIEPGKNNPKHSHSNCEEILFVLSGEGDHWIGDEKMHIRPGSMLRVARGQVHWAECTSWEPLKMIITYSAPDRKTEMCN